MPRLWKVRPKGRTAFKLAILGFLLLPLVRVGFAPAVQAQQAQATGVIEICKDKIPWYTGGVFDFTIDGQDGHHYVAPGTCTPPIRVPTGRVRIRENNTPEDIIMISARTDPPGRVIAVDPVAGTVDVNVPAGDPSVEVVVSLRQVPAGWVEFCKKGDGVLTGTFPVTYTPRNEPSRSGTVDVPVGACTGPIKVPAGPLDFAEEQRTGTRLTAVEIRVPYDGTRQIYAVGGVFTVDIKPGDASSEIVVTIKNGSTAELKLCKVAGDVLVAVGTEFAFTITDGVNEYRITIPAGPFPEGFCKFVPLPDGYLAGTPITISEYLGPLPDSIQWAVPQVVVNNDQPVFSQAVTFRLLPGLNLVTYTNDELEPGTRLKICKVAGNGVQPGTMFTFDLSAAGREITAVTVPAGPAPGGYCEFVPENVYRIGDVVTVTERAGTGVQTTAISVLPAIRQYSSANLNARSIDVVAGDGVTTVTFTNATGRQQAVDDASADSSASADPSAATADPVASSDQGQDPQ